jgi:cytochrome c551/c552
MNKKYVGKLSLEERAELTKIVAKGKAAIWKIQRCYALLQCDQGSAGPSWKDEAIAEAYGITPRSLESWRKQAVEQGPLSLLERQPRTVPATAFKLDGAAEARLTKLACSQPPEGHARWTLRLLADHLVALEVVASISHETVRQALKKTNSSRGAS